MYIIIFLFHLSYRKTPTWQFSTRPVVPQYCCWTPAEWSPRLGKPLSSRTITGKGGAGSARSQGRGGGEGACQRKVRRSSRTPSSSQTARENRRWVP